MARIDNLGNFLTDVASAIKTQKGDESNILASDFDTEILALNTGHLTDEEYNEAMNDVDNILENTQLPTETISIIENGTIDVTNYSIAEVNVDSSRLSIDESVYYSQTNAIKSFITEVNDIDLTKNQYTSFGNLFNGCSNLIRVKNLKTTNVTFFYQMFAQCNNLLDVPVLDTSSATQLQNMFKGCIKLTEDSLNNILQMCINAMSYTGTKTLKEIGLSETQATTCQTLSNYEAFLDAGWTTGY